MARGVVHPAQGGETPHKETQVASFPDRKEAWEETMAVSTGSRRTLVAPAEPMPSFSLWSFLKDAAGKELYDMPLPIGYYAPLSEVQYRTEELEFSELLDQAAELPKASLDRALLVAGFALSHYQSTLRGTKLAIPMLGETFDVVLPEKGVRVLCEAVLQDYKDLRFTNAWVAEGQRWVMEADDEPKINFKGATMDLKLHWRDQITFDDGDTYAYTKPTATAHNLIMGKPYLTHKGTIAVRNQETGLTISLTFHEPGMLNALSKKKTVKHEMRGVVEQDGELMEGVSIHGTWHEGLYASMPDGSQRTMWKNKPLPADPSRYMMTELCIRLNEMTPELDATVPPTDSRRRKCLRALEEGRYDEAQALKLKLETKNSALCKSTTESWESAAPSPRWFGLRAPDALSWTPGEQLRWRYKGGYWAARAAKKWEGIPSDFFDS